jgi:hypothetical protein
MNPTPPPAPRQRHLLSALPALAAGLLAAAASAQTFQFTYQGKLDEAAGPANGVYDFRFRLTDALGQTFGTPVCLNDQQVTAGLFTAILNFANAPYTGRDYLLEIQVRPGNQGDCSNPAGFTLLTPNQPVTPAPQSIYAASAGALLGRVSELSVFGTYDRPTSFTNPANAFSGAFSGDGQNISVLNASSLTLGTVPDAALPINLARTDQPNTFSGVNRFNAFTGINRDFQLTGNELFGIGGRPGNGFDGMYISDVGPDAAPFYGYETDNGRAFNWLDATNRWRFVGSPFAGTSSLSFDFPTGNLGVGTLNPAAGLHIVSTNPTSGLSLNIADQLFARPAANFAGLGRSTPDLQFSFLTVAENFAVTTPNSTGSAFVDIASKGAWEAGLAIRSPDRNSASAFTIYPDSLLLQYRSPNPTGYFAFSQGLTIGSPTPGPRALNIRPVASAAVTRLSAANNGLQSDSVFEFGLVLDANNTRSNNFAIADVQNGRDLVNTPNLLIQKATGFVGINTPEPTQSLDVNGNIRSRGADFILTGRGGGIGNTSRSGRALVDGGWPGSPFGFIAGGGLIINFGNDFGIARIDSGLVVNGNLSKAGGSFLIDHPLDPANKVLYHSFVESPDMKNIYDGVVTTDGDGYATVTLPDYFSALNRDFRYQLTVIGTLGDDESFAVARVVRKIDDRNQFTIKTSLPLTEVSWQVTGIRHDAWANANRIPNAVDKPEHLKGRYLHPQAHGRPATEGVSAAITPAQSNR